MQFDYHQQPGLTRWNKHVVKTEEPLVSIITPYFNGGKFIQQTCNCILDQTFPYFEWIIVNDGSTKEEDIKLLDDIAGQDPRIHVLHKENGGIATARNLGIRHARADYVLLLDSDDLIEPTLVEYCWWMLQKNPGAAWAYTDSLGFQGQEYLWEKKFDPILLKTENHLTHCGMIRKDAIWAIGGYCEKYKHYNEDWYAWLRLVGAGGYPVQSCGEHLFWYRRSNTGVLSIVRTDKEIAKANKALIASAAAKVIDPHAPIIYPRQLTNHWASPHMSDWNRCVYEKKAQKHIAFLFPHLEMGDSDKFNLDLLSGLDSNQYEISVLTTLPSRNEGIQKFRSITPNVFNLANFVAPEDYAEFVSYYLISRQVDILFVTNSCHGYYLIPWLRQNFPKLAIVDYVHMEEGYRPNGGYARISSALAAVTEKTYVSNSVTEKEKVANFGRNPDSVETLHMGVDTADNVVAFFEKEFERLTVDETLKQRREAVAAALQMSSPLAAELLILGMQTQSAEDAWCVCQNKLERFLEKVERILREDGFPGFLRKALQRVKKKLSGVFHAGQEKPCVFREDVRP